MKKILFVSSICLFLTGGGLKLAPAPVSATTPLKVAQNNDLSQTAPAVPNRLELLTTGAEPRQELRFKPRVNAKQTMTMTMNMDITGSLAGQAMPKVKVPASVMKMDVLVTQVDANGDIHSKFSYTDADVVADPSVPPEMFNAMQSALQKMVGLSGSSITDNRGQIKSANFVLPEGSDPLTKQLLEQLSNSLDQFSSPVPQEAVGIGAKWRVSSSLKPGGINLTQRAVYELVSLKDNVATFNISFEQQANAQELPLPGAPSGLTVSLKSLTAQGQGQMTVPLDAAVPTRTTLSIRSKNEMNIKDPRSGKDMPIETQVSMQMNLESQLSK
jgi:hypothetical protein